jgi:hypothetical protein
MTTTQQVNNTTLAGCELIAAQRERQVLYFDHSILSDALKYKIGELLHVALALIHGNYSFAPESWKEKIKPMMESGDVERLIHAGSFIAAQIDVYNLLTQIDESVKSATPYVQDENEGRETYFANLTNEGGCEM